MYPHEHLLILFKKIKESLGIELNICVDFVQSYIQQFDNYHLQEMWLPKINLVFQKWKQFHKFCTLTQEFSYIQTLFDNSKPNVMILFKHAE